MIKRLLHLFGRRPKPARPDPLPHPDQDPANDVYLIGITLQVEVAAEPRDTFTARAQRLLFKALETSASRIQRSVFNPIAGGRVEMHEIPPDRKKQ